jgi:hypothetical protein
MGETNGLGSATGITFVSINQVIALQFYVMHRIASYHLIIYPLVIITSPGKATIDEFPSYKPPFSQLIINLHLIGFNPSEKYESQLG